MKILFIRHGETTDNVAHVYAGVTDSALTSHGVLQTSRLASHLAPMGITHIFTSPLQRAHKTAEAIQAASSSDDAKVSFTVDPNLIEQDFGSFEGEAFLSSTPKIERMRAAAKLGVKPAQIIGKKRKMESDSEDEETMTKGEEGPLSGDAEEEVFKEMENTASITARAETFLLRHIVPMLLGKLGRMPFKARIAPSRANKDYVGDPVVAIVSHGILLSFLWKAFIALFHPTSVLAITPVVQKGWYQGKHPGWGNTGYLQVNVLAGNNSATSGDTMTVVIEGVNEKEHLKTLKRTGGGVGSARYDDKQKRIDGFFVKKDGTEDNQDEEEEEGEKEQKEDGKRRKVEV